MEGAPGGRRRVVKAAASTQLLDSLAERVPNPILKAAIKVCYGHHTLVKINDEIRRKILRSHYAFRLGVQEPVAFAGGVFAGALGLNLQEEPLKGWVERTKTQAGVRSSRSIYDQIHLIHSSRDVLYKHGGGGR